MNHTKSIRLLWLAYAPLLLLVLLSLLLNMAMLNALLTVRRQAAQALAQARQGLSSLEGVMTDYTFEYTIHYEDTLLIETDIPFENTLTVPIDTTVPINTTVTVNIPILGQSVPMNIPIATQVPLSLEVEIPVSQSFHVQAPVPVSLNVPLSIPMTQLQGPIDSLTSALDEVLADAQEALEEPLLPWGF